MLVSLLVKDYCYNTTLWENNKYYHPTCQCGKLGHQQQQQQQSLALAPPNAHQKKKRKKKKEKKERVLPSMLCVKWEHCSCYAVRISQIGTKTKLSCNIK